MVKFRAIMNSYIMEHHPMFEMRMFTAQSDFDRAKFVMNMIRTKDPVPAVSPTQKCERIAMGNISDGNDYFAKRDFSNALECFNKAILHAPANSVPFIEGFEKRSECLISIGFHKEALFSVEQALKCTGIRRAYKEKLERQKIICEELAGSSSSSAASSCPNVSLPLIRNKYLTSASNKVLMTTNTSVGRLLKANADMRTGEVIMIDEPYARGTNPDLRFLHCWNCSKYCKTPYPCTKCRDAMFCSQNCLEEAKKYHDFECPLMNLLIFKLGVRQLYFLALHMFLIATERGTKLNELKRKVDNIDAELRNSMTYDSNDFIRIYGLMYHPTVKPAYFYFYFTFLAGYIVSALNKYTNLFEAASSDLQVFACSLLLRFFLSVGCNAQTVTATGLQDEEFVAVGDAMYAAFSLFNHSCDPNVERHFFNQSLVVRALRPIKAGEELNANYRCTFSFESLSDRQAKLAQYNFTCGCKACEHGWPMYPSQLATLPELKKPMDDTTRSRFSDLSNDFTNTFKYELKNNDLQLVNFINFTPKIMDWLCEFIDLMTEYFDIPNRRLTEALEAFKLGLDRVPGFQRSLGTTKDTAGAAPSNE